MAYQYTDYSGYGDESDEERRKRRLSMFAGLAGGMPVGDVASQYLTNRLNEAGQNFTNAANIITDPAEEMKRRMGVIQQQPSVQVAGPAQLPQQPQQGMTAQSISPQELDMAEMERLRQERLARQAQPAQAAPQAQAPVPQLSQSQQAAQRMGVQTQPAAQQVEQQPQWAKDLIASQGDMTKLHAYVGNEQYPEAQRKWAAGLLQKMYKDEADRDDAVALVQRYVAGDPSAINTVTKEMRKRSSEGSYLKAYLFNRLGFTELAKEEQFKLGAGGRVEQAMVDGKQYTVERDAQGGVQRAWNSKGTEVGEDTLAKISAGGAKFGGQRYSTTGGSLTIPAGQPDAGQEYSRVFDSVEGKFKNLITTGPNAGQEYRGSPGFEKRVESNQQIALNDAFIKFQTAPSIAAATTMMELAAKLDRGDNIEVNKALAQIQAVSPQIFSQIRGAVPGTAPSAMPAGATTVPGQVQTQVPAPQQVQRPIAPEQVAGQAPAPAPQQVQRPPAPQQGVGVPAVQGTGGIPYTTAGGGLSRQAQLEQQKSNIALGQAAREAQIGIAKERSQSYNEYLDKELAPQAENGNTVVSVRKQQFAIFDRDGIDPNKLFGLYNAAQENPSDQKYSIIRDIFGGIFKPEAEVSQRLAQLNLTPAEKSALQEYNIANQRINVATLKQTAGAGSVSDAEQRANRESNVDISKIPALGAFNAMAQSQFDGDRARWKADWAIRQPANNRIELDAAWRKESQRLSKIYEDMAKERIKFINQNGNTYNAVREGYRRFPIPEYDPDTNTWKKTRPLGAILGR